MCTRRPAICSYHSRVVPSGSEEREEGTARDAAYWRHGVLRDVIGSLSWNCIRCFTQAGEGLEFWNEAAEQYATW